jgi:hypothetical protein
VLRFRSLYFWQLRSERDANETTRHGTFGKYWLYPHGADNQESWSGLLSCSRGSWISQVTSKRVLASERPMIHARENRVDYSDATLRSVRDLRGARWVGR